MGLAEVDALLHFNLAPLNSCRDIAGLGLIHRAVLGKGPPHFQKWFFLRNVAPAYSTRHQEAKHNKQVHEYVDGNHTELLRRSLLGHTRVYNGLTQAMVDSKTVKVFQKKLQERLKEKAREAQEHVGPYSLRPWKLTHSVRNSW